MSDVKPLTDDEFNWDLVERCIERHAPALAQWFYEQRAALASKEAECERLREALESAKRDARTLTHADEFKPGESAILWNIIDTCDAALRPSGSAK